MSRVTTCALAIVFMATGCRETPPKHPEVRTIRMATMLGRLTFPLAEALTKVLPDHFAVRVQVEKTETTKDYLRLLAQGEAASIISTNSPRSCRVLLKAGIA